jgi:hypothetical protein
VYVRSFRPLIRNDYQTVFTNLFMQLGASSVTFDLPPHSLDKGAPMRSMNLSLGLTLLLFVSYVEADPPFKVSP